MKYIQGAGSASLPSMMNRLEPSESFLHRWLAPWENVLIARSVTILKPKSVAFLLPIKKYRGRRAETLSGHAENRNLITHAEILFSNFRVRRTLAECVPTKVNGGQKNSLGPTKISLVLRSVKESRKNKRCNKRIQTKATNVRERKGESGDLHRAALL